MDLERQEVPIMAIPSKSAQLFRERAGLTPTSRGPIPKLAPGINKARQQPVSPPLPRPAYMLDPQPPDRGLSEVWPHGVDGESQQ
jgi:hypothetical protein